MVAEERDWRESEGAQRAMAEAEQSGVRDWMRVVEDFQISLCRRYGWDDQNLESGLRFLRSAAPRVRLGLTSSSVLRCAPWIKYNRLTLCPVALGALIPSMSLWSESVESVVPLFPEAEPVDAVIIASSVS